MRSLVAVLAFSLASSAAFAAQPRTYQVTGEVLEVTDDTVTVAKGKEKWEIARTADTKTEGEIKKGEKITVEYRMTAAKIEAKPGKGKK